MADERRRNERISAAQAGLTVRNLVDGDTLGVVGNLSRGGMMLICTRELFADGILQLSIESLPDVAGAESIAAGVKVLWVTPANTPEQCWAGLEIIDIDAHARGALDRLLDYLAGN